MPELPEVETIVRDLDQMLRGARIADVEVIRPDLLEGVPAERFSAGLRGREVRGVTRRAKNIVFDLGADRLVVNLGMTGRLLVGRPGEIAPTHLGVRIALDDGRVLLYHDVRRFGRLEVMPAARWSERDRSLGLEPLGDAFTPEALFELTRRSRVALKTWLMDQRYVVGVGNIYASEALFRAGVDPRRPAHSLSHDEAVQVHAAVRDVLREAIEFRGTTLLDYRDASGESGGFSERLQVYDRAGHPCRRCAVPIQRIVQGGRSTFFCPSCQG